MMPAPLRSLGAAAAVAFALLAGAPDAGAGSETPPKGPPWVRDFHAAQATALAEGKPVFVYMTKTH